MSKKPKIINGFGVLSDKTVEKMVFLAELIKINFPASIFLSKSGRRIVCVYPLWRV